MNMLKEVEIGATSRKSVRDHYIEDPLPLSGVGGRPTTFCQKHFCYLNPREGKIIFCIGVTCVKTWNMDMRAKGKVEKSSRNVLLSFSFRLQNNLTKYSNVVFLGLRLKNVNNIRNNIKSRKVKKTCKLFRRCDGPNKYKWSDQGPKSDRISGSGFGFDWHHFVFIIALRPKYATP